MNRPTFWFYFSGVLEVTPNDDSGVIPDNAQETYMVLGIKLGSAVCKASDLTSI